VIYRAIVADNRDPAERGRIKVMIPSITGTAISEWVWPVVTGGYLFIPEPGEQVWVMFENGDQDVPVWLGKTKQKEGGDVHPSAPWAVSQGAEVGGEELEERVQRLEQFLGLR
jgi:hypothetical protein